MNEIIECVNFEVLKGNSNVKIQIKDFNCLDEILTETKEYLQDQGLASFTYNLYENLFESEYIILIYIDEGELLKKAIERYIKHTKKAPYKLFWKSLLKMYDFKNAYNNQIILNICY